MIMASENVTLEEAARIIVGEMRNICSNDIDSIVALMDLLDSHVQALYENMTVELPKVPGMRGFMARYGGNNGKTHNRAKEGIA
jgi:hypothetical protein